MQRSFPCVAALVMALLAGCGPRLGTIAVEPPVTSSKIPPRIKGSKPASQRILCDRVLEDFVSTPEGAFPTAWRTRKDDEKAAAVETGAYVVERESGRSVLHATYRDQPITIALPVEGWDLDAYPILQWSWRAVRLPERADERDLGTNDSTASVYVVWEVGLPFMIRGIRYAWSSTLPVGTTISRRLGYDKVVVMSSGPSSEWKTARVDVRQHYAELFGRDDAAPPSGIAVLTDADSTGSVSEAYYADFRLCRIVSEP